MQGLRNELLQAIAQPIFVVFVQASQTVPDVVVNHLNTFSDSIENIHICFFGTVRRKMNLNVVVKFRPHP